MLKVLQPPVIKIVFYVIIKIVVLTILGPEYSFVICHLPVRFFMVGL